MKTSVNLGGVFQVQILKKTVESNRKSPEEFSMLFWSDAFKSDTLRWNMFGERLLWRPREYKKLLEKRVLIIVPFR